MHSYSRSEENPSFDCVQTNEVNLWRNEKTRDSDGKKIGSLDEEIREKWIMSFFLIGFTFTFYYM